MCGNLIYFLIIHMIMSVLPSFAERKRYPFHARVFRRCTLSRALNENGVAKVAIFDL